MLSPQRTRIYDAQRFARRMERSLRGVLSVFIGTEQTAARCTGWLLTHRLAVIPAYALQPQDKGGARLESVLGNQRWEAEAEEQPEILGEATGTDRDHFRVALLRLKSKKSRAPLRLSLEQPQPADLISLLHFPSGAPALAASFGRLTSLDERILRYEIDSEPGSGGGPLFDAEWRIVGIHLLRDQEGRCQGLTRAALLELLQTSASWQEIADAHHLANVVEGRKRLSEDTAPDADRPGDALIKAALKESFLPASLSEQDRELLRDKIVETAGKRWTLQTGVRQSVLRSAGTLEELRKKRGPKRHSARPGQQVIDRILDGPPYDLSSESEEALTWWIRATRWFAGIHPDLPKPSTVTQILERRRIRSRLEAIAGPNFRGRATQLKTMRTWFKSQPAAPLCVFGIGGIGKSALVAKFASELPPDTLLLRLDFDRADLAPDDADSILEALREQTALQIEEFKAPDAPDSNWQAAAQALGKAIAKCLSGKPAPLLVLDSFEVAQYAEHYQELWPVLEALVKEAPSLRVIVSGRAKVNNVQLGGNKARPLPLLGMPDAEVEAWLRERGIRKPRVVRQVVKTARGIPLILQLAFQLVKADESLDDLPAKLASDVIPGYLYRRILRRVQNPQFEELAKASLVLRRLTVEMVTPVLQGLIALPPDEPKKWFAEFARETGLVTGTDTLRLRPEVRSAALRLLEAENLKLVRSIEQRAEHWYQQQDGNNPEIAAELVYHRLRRDDIAGAKAAWRDGCAIHLANAEEDLKDKPRAWLRARTRTGAAGAGADISEARASEAVDRIRDLRARGRVRGIQSIISEGERTVNLADDPLVFQEAYEFWLRGNKDKALQLVERAGPASGPVGRDRAVLHALLLSEKGDPIKASEVLTPLSNAELWANREFGHFEVLAVQAARIRLAVDLDLEAQAIKSPGFSGPGLLSTMDIVSPLLQSKVSTLKPEAARLLDVPGEPSKFPAFAAEIEKLRKASLAVAPTIAPADADLAKKLTSLADRRWEVVTSTPFLAEVRKLLSESGSLLAGPGGQAIAASFVLFGGNMGDADLGLWEPFRKIMGSTNAFKTFGAGSPRSHDLAAAILGLSSFRNIQAWWLATTGSADSGLIRQNFLAWYFIFAPDPLKSLTESLAGSKPTP